VAVADIVFVAPHFDDVALSCGGLVAAKAESESPLIVTIFGGQPTEVSNPFAKELHANWQLGDESVVAQRRAEDECAAGQLGATVRTHWFGWLDAIYRNECYDSNEALFGRPDRLDIDLPREIADALSHLAADQYVMPLAVGNHVDHQIVYEAGQILTNQGYDIWNYLDVPYSIDRGALQEHLAELEIVERWRVFLNDEWLERRLAAIDCYPSQLPVIFQRWGSHRDAIVRFATEQGDGEPVEIYLRVKGELSNGTAEARR
jgi:LmbE family N-acetylglucosaminyl deacetylase